MKNTTAKSRIKPFKPAKSRLRKDMYVSPSKKQGASFLMGIILGGSYLVYSEYRMSAVVDAFNDSTSTPVQCLERQSRDLSTPNTKGEPHKQSFSIVPKAQAYEAPEAPKNVNVSVEQIIREEWGKDAEIGLKIAFCESSYNPTIKNKNSTATGLFQIIKGTWKENRKKMGLDTDIELRKDARENAKTAYFIYQHRGSQPWVSSSHCHGE